MRPLERIGLSASSYLADHRYMLSGVAPGPYWEPEIPFVSMITCSYCGNKYTSEQTQQWRNCPTCAGSWQ